MSYSIKTQSFHPLMKLVYSSYVTGRIPVTGHDTVLRPKLERLDVVSQMLSSVLARHEAPSGMRKADPGGRMPLVQEHTAGHALSRAA